MPDEKNDFVQDDIDETDFDEEFDEDFDIAPDDDLLAFEKQLETDAGFDPNKDDEADIEGFEDDEE